MSHSRRYPRGPYLLVKRSGLMDDIIVGDYKTLDAAQKGMRQKGGTPDSMFQNGLRITNILTSGEELVEVFGKWMLRPKARH